MASTSTPSDQSGGKRANEGQTSGAKPIPDQDGQAMQAQTEPEALPGQSAGLQSGDGTSHGGALTQQTGAIDHGHDHDHGSAVQSQRQSFDRDSIPGWGADLDRNMRPGVPMERMPPRLPPGSIKPLTQQAETIEVFHSPERPGITPLFGTSSPPSGLSGAIRRAAYKLTENDIRHWLLLLMADRVNVVEGIGQDLARGKIPNVLAEMGIAAEWKYNKAGLARKVAITGAVLGIGWYLMQGRKRS
jgi:hypothetical protein